MPLRPLNAGEILEAAIKAVRKHWRLALGASLGVALLTQAVITVLARMWPQNTAELEALSRDPHPTVHQLIHAMSTPLLTSSADALVRTLGTVLATAVLTTVVSRSVLGRAVSLSDTWRDARPQLLRLLGLLLLVPLLVSVVLAVATAPGLVALAAGSDASAAGLLFLGLIAGTVAAVWLWVRLSLAAPALMLEKQGVRNALRRSAKLVRGSWWRVLGIQLLALLLLVFVATLVTVPATLIGTLAAGDGLSSLTSGAAEPSWASLIASGIGSVVAYTLTFPVTAGVTVLLYLDQRIRRESLDIELTRAAARNVPSQKGS